MAKWEEQFKRIERWAERLDEMMTTADTIFTRCAASYADDWHAFFVECYAMKDWLKNDPEFRHATNKEIEQYVSDTESLRFCADLANGKKHLVVDRPRSTSETVNGLRFTFAVCKHDAVCEPSNEDTSASDADKIKEAWIELGVDPGEITIQVFCDPIVDGDWTNHNFDGGSDLAYEAVRAWREFTAASDS